MSSFIRLVVLAILSLPLASASAQDLPEVALETANSLASKGKLGKAVPYYKKALLAGGQNFPLAYFNLAQVQQARGECEEAGLMYQLYAAITDTDEARADASAGIKACKGDKWPSLSIRGESGQATKVKINGFLASVDGTFGPAALPPGEYEVEIFAVDHHPETRTVTLEGENQAVDVKLRKMLFNGKLLVNASVPGARIRIFEGPSEESKVLFDLRAPMAGGVEVSEGRHFVEVTSKGRDRWIRNVSVGRDDLTTVDVTLNRARPPELK